MENRLTKIVELMNVGYSACRKHVEEASKPKGLFAAFRKEPNLMDLAMIVEGYRHVLAFVDTCTDELSVFHLISDGIDQAEKDLQATDNEINGAVSLGLLKGRVWALLDFHRAMKYAHGPNYGWPTGEQRKILEILTRYRLQDKA